MRSLDENVDRCVCVRALTTCRITYEQPPLYVLIVAHRRRATFSSQCSGPDCRHLATVHRSSGGGGADDNPGCNSSTHHPSSSASRLPEQAARPIAETGATPADLATLDAKVVAAAKLPSANQLAPRCGPAIGQDRSGSKRVSDGGGLSRSSIASRLKAPRCAAETACYAELRPRPSCICFRN